ncbi:Eukaryotic translation initiation factor 3 [Neofusicoccum parvum]|uniref:Eukaryotic translation initiation factor 3 subunit J n=2 Tax=Neofusicoccum parvum TaxID=310453 RepID=R1ENA4_BOTPV|nr:putative eukaryotic translation initiation factor 3 subunit j protein [Neofusicoccum parvum UCRNP2]GME28404.1 Eukaryotic translation initiation factor 3 [Neofusicoccum parvum]GME52142.1 Eukaryotic translation initiation factor 3 [Neofusicoccum parvum]
MPPSKWDDESEEESNSPPAPVVRRGKFDDEEDDDEVLDSWDAADDSEVEREKAKKAAEAKAKAEAEAKANHKSKSQRMKERIEENKARKAAEWDDSEEEEDEAARRLRLRKSEMDSDLAAAEDLFGELAIGSGSKRSAAKPTVLADPSDSTNTIDLSTLKIFNPTTKDDFHKLRETLAPLLSANAKKPQYALFLQEFCKQIAKELPSDQIKKVSSGLTTLSNEKLKEEKAAEKGGKKTKAAKTKTSLNASRDVSFKADTATYDDDFGE